MCECDAPKETRTPDGDRPIAKCHVGPRSEQPTASNQLVDEPARLSEVQLGDRRPQQAIWRCAVQGLCQRSIERITEPLLWQVYSRAWNKHAWAASVVMNVQIALTLMHGSAVALRTKAILGAGPVLVVVVVMRVMRMILASAVVGMNNNGRKRASGCGKAHAVDRCDGKYKCHRPNARGASPVRSGQSQDHPMLIISQSERQRKVGFSEALT